MFRAFTACAGVGIVIGMVFTMMSSLMTIFMPSSLSSFIIALFLTPSGCIVFIVEWEKLFYDAVLKKVPFLRHQLGRSLFYLYLAGLLFALANVTGYILGSAFLFISAVHAILKYTRGDSAESMPHQELQEMEYDQPIADPSTQTYSTQPSAPGSRSLNDDGSDFGAQAGAAAFNWASQNPEHAQAAANFAFNVAKENPELGAKMAKAVM
jgi:hypothetical protein